MVLLVESFKVLLKCLLFFSRISMFIGIISMGLAYSLHDPCGYSLPNSLGQAYLPKCPRCLPCVGHVELFPKLEPQITRVLEIAIHYIDTEPGRYQSQDTSRKFPLNVIILCAIDASIAFFDIPNLT